MVSYKPLWKTLIDKEMSTTDLRSVTGLAPNTITKLKHNIPVSLSVLERICKELDCDFSDVVGYVRDK